MLYSECLECGKTYNSVKIKDGKTKTITHGFCPECLKKVRARNKAQREKEKKCSQTKH